MMRPHRLYFIKIDRARDHAPIVLVPIECYR